ARPDWSTADHNCCARFRSNGAVLDNLKDGLDLDRNAGGQGRETQGAAGVVAQGVLAEELVKEIGGTVDDQVLVGEVRRRVHTPQELQHAQPIERSVGLADRLKYLDSTFSGRLVALLDREARSELALDVADVA